MDNVHHDVQISDLNKKNKRSIDPTIYPVGQVVFIHKEDVLGKSDVLFDGPFLISEVTSDEKYRLKDSNSNCLPREYDRSQLKIPAFYKKTLAESDFNGTSVRYLDYLKSHRTKLGKLEYLVKWMGLDDSHDEWVYKSFVEKSAILDYVAAIKGKNFPKKKLANIILLDNLEVNPQPVSSLTAPQIDDLVIMSKRNMLVAQLKKIYCPNIIYF